jgi:exodeoxyribonuclease-3
MRVISWNVNGIRAVAGKNAAGEPLCEGQISCMSDLNVRYAPDVLVLQEIKCNSVSDMEKFRVLYPHIAASFAEKKGYSGVAVMSKKAPQEVFYDFRGEHPHLIASPANAAPYAREGRLVTAVFEEAVVVGVYVPNAKAGLVRIDERGHWEMAMLAHLAWVKAAYPYKAMIYCGDLNVAHQEIDICNPKSNTKSAGYSPQERGWFSQLLACGMIDTFRHLNPGVVKYSWWSPITRARTRNAGWRIDYCLLDAAQAAMLRRAEILNDVFGSDHCPVLLEISE